MARTHLTISLVAGALALGAAAGCAHGPPAPRPASPADFTPIPEAEAAAVKNPHAYQGKPLCQRCHEPGASGVKTDPIALCTECHDPAYMRHPFRVEAPPTATGLPLMPGRLIACHTCHEPHDVKARHAGLRADYTALCTNCHAQHTRSSGGAPHPVPKKQQPSGEGEAAERK